MELFWENSERPIEPCNLYIWSVFYSVCVSTFLYIYCLVAIGLLICFFFSIWVFFHDHSWTYLYHFHPLHKHLDISQAITAESSLR